MKSKKQNDDVEADIDNAQLQLTNLSYSSAAVVPTSTSSSFSLRKIINDTQHDFMIL